MVATHCAFGMASRTRASRGRQCRHDIVAIPVMLPPGRSMLATRPVSTGSEPSGNTIGIPPEADFAARIAGGVAGMMTSTPSPWSSAARAGRRSNLPSANLQTSSMFDPSTYPSSLRPRVSSFHQSLIPSSVAGLKMPIRGMCPDALLLIFAPHTVHESIASETQPANSKVKNEKTKPNNEN